MLEALKVIAGTPDYDELVDIKFKQNDLIDSGHRQITINTKTHERINELASTVRGLKDK